MVRRLSSRRLPRPSPASPQDSQRAQPSAPTSDHSPLAADRRKPLSHRASPLSRPRPARTSYAFVSNHSSENDAFIALQSYDAFSYVLKYNTGAQGQSKVYVCRGHKQCGRHFRIRLDKNAKEDGETKYVLENGGEHATEPSNVKRSGIHPAHIGEIDAALLKSGPEGVLKMLRKKYADQPSVLKALPTPTQIKNRKAHVMKRLGDKNDQNRPTPNTSILQATACEI